MRINRWGQLVKVPVVVTHQCISGNFMCIQYAHDPKKFYLNVEYGDIYDDGYSDSTTCSVCPFCGLTLT